MPEEKRHRGQAGFEYLITYGWALVAVATIVGILVFANTGAIDQTSCTSFMHLLCKGIGFEENNLVIILQNAAGQAITINPAEGIALNGSYGYAVLVYKGQEHYFEDAVIGAGEEFTVKALGEAETGKIAITFTENGTGIERTEESPIKVKEIKKTAIESCGHTISKPGVYVLGSDIGTSSGDCITIAADNVTLDCQGYSIEGQQFPSDDDDGIYVSGQKNITIKNCEIPYFNQGIRVELLENTVIANNRIYESKFGILVNQASNVKIIGNNVNNNENHGIWINTSTGIGLLNNNANSNGSIGISINDTFDAVLKNNTACNSGTSNDLQCDNSSQTGTGNVLTGVSGWCTGIAYTPCP